MKSSRKIWYVKILKVTKSTGAAQEVLQSVTIYIQRYQLNSDQ